MIKLNKCYSLLASAFLGLSAPLAAQVFTAPVAQQSIFPSGAVIQRPSTASNYSVASISSGFGTADFYISGWSGGTSGFNWRLSSPGSPNSIFAQGTFPYSNVMDMEVGFVNAGGTYLAYVAYFKIGAGHRLDVYKLTGSTATPIVLSSTMVLSNSPNYGRIRIDSHKLYGNAVVWEYPGIGIQTIVANNGTFGNVIDLVGTNTDSDPDVAFSHSNAGGGTLNVHFAYHDKGAGKVIESVLPWPVLLTATSPLPPTIEDVNFVGTSADLRVVLDCPDHYDVENWAYAYTSDYTNISVRLIDYHSGGVPVTAIMNDGSLGNIPTAYIFKGFYPTLFYGDGSLGTQIQTGWYTYNGSGYNGYIGVHINESGTALLSNPDYMRLPNSTTPSNYPSRPGISYSKMSDNGLVPNNMYGVFYDYTNVYRFHHVFHPWGAPVFRGTANTVHPECGSQTLSVLNQVTETGVKLYPNPFHDVVSAYFTTKEAGTAQLQLIDMTGKLVRQASLEVQPGSQTFTTNNLEGIPAGMYLLDISVNGTRISQQKVVKN